MDYLFCILFVVAIFLQLLDLRRTEGKSSIYFALCNFLQTFSLFNLYDFTDNNAFEYCMVMIISISLSLMIYSGKIIKVNRNLGFKMTTICAIMFLIAVLLLLVV